MIVDTISNYKRYLGINPGIDRLLAEAVLCMPESFSLGRISVDGDRLYMNFSEYDTHELKDGMTEAHRRYVDVMYMVEGAETVYIKPVGKLGKIIRDYDADSDALLAETESDCNAIRLEAGSFLILFPEDAHAPGCHCDEPGHVKKIIGKVLL